MRKLLYLLPLLASSLPAQNIDYSRLRNTPTASQYDQSTGAQYSTFTLACNAANTLGRTLTVDKEWTAIPSGTYSCPLEFVKGGKLTFAASATVTLAGAITADAYQQIFDASVATSLVGTGAAINSAISPLWFISGTVITNTGTQAAVNFLGSTTATRKGRVIFPRGATASFSGTVIISKKNMELDCGGTAYGSPGIAWTGSAGVALFRVTNGVNGLYFHDCFSLGNTSARPLALVETYQTASDTGTTQNNHYARLTAKDGQYGMSISNPGASGWVNNNTDSSICENCFFYNNSLAGVFIGGTQATIWKFQTLFSVNNGCGISTVSQTYISDSSFSNNTTADFCFPDGTSGGGTGAGVIIATNHHTEGSARLADMSTAPSESRLVMDGFNSFGLSAAVASDCKLIKANSNAYVRVVIQNLTFTGGIPGGSACATSTPLFDFTHSSGGPYRYVDFKNLEPETINHSNFLLSSIVSGASNNRDEYHFHSAHEAWDYVTGTGWTNSASFSPTASVTRLETVQLPSSGLTAWTPVLTFGGGSTGMTGTFTGDYWSFGGIIQARGAIVLTAKGASTGSATICGLPTSGATLNQRWGGSVGYMDGMTGTNYLILSLNQNSSCIDIYNNNAGTNGTMTHANFNNNTNLQFAITYHQ